RVLLGLLGVALFTMVLAMAGVIGWILQLLVDLVAVAFVVHLRTQAKRSAALARTRRRAPSSTSAVAQVPVAPDAAGPMTTPTAARYAARMARSADAARAAALPAE